MVNAKNQRGGRSVQARDKIRHDLGDPHQPQDKRQVERGRGDEKDHGRYQDRSLETLVQHLETQSPGQGGQGEGPDDRQSGRLCGSGPTEINAAHDQRKDHHRRKEVLQAPESNPSLDRKSVV